MPYIIRSKEGLTLSENDSEKVFQSESKAQEYLSILQFNTIEEWHIIKLNEK